MNILYHTKRYKGTTTDDMNEIAELELYHTKRYKGTTTPIRSGFADAYYIIPKDIRELRLWFGYRKWKDNYIIPKDIRELRRNRNRK